MTQHFIPPVNFGMVETDLYRSGQPNELNLPFLEQLRLRTIIFLSAEEPSLHLAGFVADHGIRLEQLARDTEGRGASMLPASAVSETTVINALAVLLEPASYPVLVCCSLGRHNTGSVVACLRKLQRWNLTSIFEEYRRFAGTKVRRLNEQFVEFFDTDLVAIPKDHPHWL